MNTLFTYFPRLTLLLVLIISYLPPAANADDAPTSKPASLLKSAEPLVENFFTVKHWEGVRNLTGVARAVFVIPSGGQVGLLLGGQWGKGFLFVRHGQQWSDPVFVKMGAFQFGILIGGQKVGLVGAVLSKPALDRVLAGKTRISGTGDMTIGVGVSGRAAGGASGGIEMLTVSTNKGLYLGGSIEGLKIWVDDDMNRLAYGDEFNLNNIVKTSEGHYPPAMALRAMLEKTAHRAVWSDDDKKANDTD
jgi:lipid-binding SYLF domain-containing protein